jgi:HEAT repeat protein
MGEVASARGDKAFAMLEQSMEDKDQVVRKGAVDAVAWLSRCKAVTILEKALNDEDPEIRLAAVEKLNHLGVAKAVLAAIQKAVKRISKKVDAEKN